MAGKSDGHGPHAVSYQGVAKVYGAFRAVDNVSFDIAHGEFTTLLGPSGSGKTTMLSMTAGAVQPDAGRILFQGRDVTHLAPHKRNIGMVFQRYTLFPNKTVGENVAFPLEVRRLDRATVAAKVKAALQMVELAAQADRYPSEISGGQAQRVAVARALVFDPALLLMDEPLGALDKSLRELLQTEIRRIQRLLRVPTLYVTHDQDEAMNMSDRIVIMRRGHVVANGRPRELYESPNSLWTAKFLGEVNAIPVHHAGLRGDQADVTLPGGGVAPARMKSRPGSGQKLVAIVRPERCRIAVRKPASPALQATIATVTYLGARQRIDLEAEGGLPLRVVMPGIEWPGEAGDRIWFSWDQDALLLVPDDESDASCAAAHGDHGGAEDDAPHARPAEAANGHGR